MYFRGLNGDQPRRLVVRAEVHPNTVCPDSIDIFGASVKSGGLEGMHIANSKRLGLAHYLKPKAQKKNQKYSGSRIAHFANLAP
jgi:hypothetical protein